MLDHLGFKEAHDHIVTIIEKVITNPENRTPDLGGMASTTKCGNAIVKAV